MSQQQPTSCDSSPHLGYNYNYDDQESQLPNNYYCESLQARGLSESTPGVYQDGDVSFYILLFSPSHEISTGP